MGISDKPPAANKSFEDLFETASASVAAESLLTAMGPQLDKAFESRLQKLFDAEPELGALLDARAQIKAVWEMKQGLSRDARRGKGAVEIFNQMLLKNL